MTGMVPCVGACAGIVQFAISFLIVERITSDRILSAALMARYRMPFAPSCRAKSSEALWMEHPGGAAMDSGASGAITRSTGTEPRLSLLAVDATIQRDPGLAHPSRRARRCQHERRRHAYAELGRSRSWKLVAHGASGSDMVDGRVGLGGIGRVPPVEPGRRMFCKTADQAIEGELHGAALVGHRQP